MKFLQLIVMSAALAATFATTANSQQEKPKVIDADALAARGEAVANADPLSAELRNQVPEGASRRGFDIGMAAAEGHTFPGPGKDRTRDSLRRDERGGFITAVSFSLDRNRNADLAARGARIAKIDPIVAAARTAQPDVLYWLGFDIATGIFGDPALGARGNTATGPGSLGIRDALSAAGQRGFNDSVRLHLSRDYTQPSDAPSGDVVSAPVGTGGTEDPVMSPSPAPAGTGSAEDPVMSPSPAPAGTGSTEDPVMSPSPAPASAKGPANMQVNSARLQIVQALLSSPEYFTNLVKGHYQRLLRRAATKNELDEWLQTLQQGGASDQVIMGILASDEYFQEAGGTTTAFLNRLSQDLVGPSKLAKPSTQELFDLLRNLPRNSPKK